MSTSGASNIKVRCRALYDVGYFTASNQGTTKVKEDKKMGWIGLGESKQRVERSMIITTQSVCAPGKDKQIPCMLFSFTSPLSYHLPIYQMCLIDAHMSWVVS